jgi:16S rRNA (guanine966-N2)-methyltransferase
MRVIAGEFRGRKLLPPVGDATRPITDRAKQSLFDILSPRIDGANVYDLFAGTGSMGLECLSRGADHATFFEADSSAVRLLRQNIASLKVEDRTTVVSTDLFRCFGQAKASRPADIIFLDPPYRFLNERADDLRTLGENLLPHLGPSGLMIFRHDEGDSLSLPGFEVIDIRDYGSMRVELLRNTGG